MMNTQLLSTLVTWAATEALLSDPERAQELGVEPRRDPKLGQHLQDDWAQASRNGVCQTAYCIAGGAVALNPEWLIVMTEERENERLPWRADKVIHYTDVPSSLRSAVKWNMLWVTGDQENVLDDDDLLIDLEDKATDILGLGGRQATTLFDGDNDASAVVSLAYRFAWEASLLLDIPEWVYDEFYDGAHPQLLDYRLKTGQLRSRV